MAASTDKHDPQPPDPDSLFREALDNATDAISMATPEGRHYYENRAFTELFGTLGERPPESCYIDQEVALRMFGIIRSGGQWTGNVQMIDRHGRARDILLRAYANKGRDGAILSLVGIHTDITGLKRARTALHDSLERLWGTLNALPDLLFELDRQGMIHSYRAPRVDLLYVPPDQFAGKSLFDVLPADAARVIRAALDEAAATGLHRGAVYSLPLKGEERWFELSIAATRIPLPPDGRMISLVRDITDRKLAELALIKLNADLERRVTERTALAERRAGQLRMLARRLAETEQTERRRIARVLHEDLQQILVGVQYQLHLLRVHDPARVAETESQIRQALRVASTLTAELSPTILYEAGLSAALPWLADQMRDKYGLDVKTEIRTACEHDDDGLAVFLYHAVRELLLNVIKHAGVKAASVVLERTDDDRLRLTVADAGRGFDTARPAASDQGFGLFEIHEQISGLGGTCTIASRPGAGTRVTLTV